MLLNAPDLPSAALYAAGGVVAAGAAIFLECFHFSGRAAANRRFDLSFEARWAPYLDAAAESSTHEWLYESRDFPFSPDLDSQFARNWRSSLPRWIGSHCASDRDIDSLESLLSWFEPLHLTATGQEIHAQALTVDLFYSRSEPEILVVVRRQ